jgi:hypothetical protein
MSQKKTEEEKSAIFNWGRDYDLSQDFDLQCLHDKQDTLDKEGLKKMVRAMTLHIRNCGKVIEEKTKK